MSGTSVVTMVDGGGGGGGGYYYRPPPFTAVQWQELEHQAMIYKYLMAGVPIPSELLVSIRRSFDSISSRFFNTSLGYSSYYGKKFDPEPGRCKRTDGKKWRCAKDAHPDSKYCERHMHRGKGRNRSRKPVESPSSASQHQAVTVAVATPPHNATGSNNSSTVAAAASSCGILQSSGGNGVYQNIPFYSIGNSDGLYSGRNVAKFQIDYGSSQNDNKEYRYVHGVHTTDGDSGNLSVEASGSIGNSGMGHHHAYDSMDEITMSKLKQHHQKHSFGEIENVKQEHHHSMQPFFDEWPTTKESWSNLGENGTWKNANSKTMLSMSIPLDYSEFSASNAHSPDDV